jgi:uncharacterized membrane protein YraQ (UPF0718 family)
MSGERPSREWRILAWLVAAFLALYFLPVEAARFQSALIEAVKLVKWYAREHVLLCLVPAFFIAGAIGVFVSQNAVMKYFGPKANKLLAYGVASVSGTILAVCSCTVLPLFGAIYLRGAGLGPAIAFLYSGPAINVLAIVMTAPVLGWQLGVARAAGAITFSVAIGALMHLFFLKEERAKAAQAQAVYVEQQDRPRPLRQTASIMAVMVAVLVFANWARSGDVRAVFLCCPGGLTTYRVEGQLLASTPEKVRIAAADGAVREIPAGQLQAVAPAHPNGFQESVYRLRWLLVAGLLAGLGAMVVGWVPRAEQREWVAGAWGFAKQIVPLLLAGVLAAGFFLGTPAAKDAGIVPHRWIQALVGNSPAVFWGYVAGSNAAAPGWLSAIWPVWTNFFASFTGVLMYFATLTEVPILRGLMDSGMGQGPALALLLAGPALSLPSMLAINSILGPKKTLAYVGLVVVMATITGIMWGWGSSMMGVGN